MTAAGAPPVLQASTSPAAGGAGPTPGPCTCLEEVDAKLAETGHCLDATMLAAALQPGAVDRPLMTIMRKDTWKPETRRGRRGKFLPTFCPFCGVAYPEPAVQALPRGADPSPTSHDGATDGL